MATTIIIPAGWNGPYASANGGVAAGVAAALVDGPVTVRLHRPPPMDVPLTVADDGDGALAVRDPDGEMVMTAAPSSGPGLTIPTFDVGAVGDGAPFPDHPAAACLVCGPDHPRGLRAFPAPVAATDTTLLATWWTPPAWAADEPGIVDERLVWGVLDCPGALAVMHADPDPVFAALGSITGELLRPLGVDERVIVAGWTLAAEGRKRHCATAILAADGEVIASTRQVTIAVPPAWAASS